MRVCLEGVFESTAKLEQCMEVFKKGAVLTSEFVNLSTAKGVLNQSRFTGKFELLSREISSRGCLKSFGSPYMSLSMIPTLKLLEYTRNAKLTFTNLVDHSGFTVTRDYITVNPLPSTKSVKASLTLRVYSRVVR